MWVMHWWGSKYAGMREGDEEVDSGRKRTDVVFPTVAVAVPGTVTYGGGKQLQALESRSGRYCAKYDGVGLYVVVGVGEGVGYVIGGGLPPLLKVCAFRNWVFV